MRLQINKILQIIFPFLDFFISSSSTWDFTSTLYNEFSWCVFFLVLFCFSFVTCFTFSTCFTWCRNCFLPWRTWNFLVSCWYHSTFLKIGPKCPSNPKNQYWAFLGHPNSCHSYRCSNHRWRTCYIQNVCGDSLGKCTLRSLRECCWICS